MGRFEDAHGPVRLCHESFRISNLYGATVWHNHRRARVIPHRFLAWAGIFSEPRALHSPVLPTVTRMLKP